MKKLFLLLIPLMLLGAGCFSSSDADKLELVTISTGEALILVNDFSFVPSNLTIRKGDTIRFLNEGSNEHKPVFDDDTTLTPSQALVNQGYWNITLNSRGSWSYHDELNENIVGTIVVK